MARKLRAEWSGACYHVINRGNYRRDLFLERGAAVSFESCLFAAADRFHWRLHAYVVMGNHFHLALETPEPNLSDGMQWLQATWAARFNRFRGETGRPFQGRFKALHVEPGHALAQVAHYIHLNPVRATLVTADKLTDYPWCSLRHFVVGERPKALVADTVLRESGGLADTAAGWRSYVEYLGVLAEEDAKLREKQFGRLSRGWAIGSAEFKAELGRKLTEQPGDDGKVAVHGADGAVHREMRAQLWEEALVRIAQDLQVNLAELPARKSAEAKVRLAVEMKAKTSVSNGWLAERLAMGPAASVSQYVRRFRLAAGGRA